MQFRCVLLFLIGAHLGRAQVSNENINTVGLDLGWVAAAQQERGWLITSAPAPPSTYKGKRSLQTGDVLLSVDGRDVSKLGPLAVARLLEDVPFRTIRIILERSGKTYDVQAFGEGVVTAGTTKSARIYSPDDLQKRGEAAPQFSLTDLQGQQHTVDLYRGTWVLLNIWGATWCSTGCLNEITALNALSTNYSTKVTVLSVAINDSPETLQRFLVKHPLSYPVLLGGTFDDKFARRYNVHLLPTNLIITPGGEIGFVGRGDMSLKGAVQTILRGLRKATVRREEQAMTLTSRRSCIGQRN